MPTTKDTPTTDDTDIKSLTAADPTIAASLAPAFAKYNEDQLATVQLPGSSTTRVVISAHNRVPDEPGRYYDVESATSFEVDHVAGKASGVRSHVLDSAHADLVRSIAKSLAVYVAEHFRDASCGVFPTADDAGVAVVIVANKYSPKNYW